MALTRPTLLNTTPFDATKEHVFNFQSSGGSTNIVANKLTIKRNDTLATVYDQQQTTFAYQHILPANTLSNGVVYQATIITIGADGSQSVASVPIIFYCLVTPTFEFTNIPSGGLLTGNSYNFELTYNQVNGEQLNSVIFNLYSSSGALLSTSGTLSNFDTIPALVSYLFSGFENNTEYYIEAVGQTVRGMSLSTSRRGLIVNYQGDVTYSDLILTNNCNEGYIAIQSIVIAISGISNPSPPIYINNSAVDLTRRGSWVEFNEGYSVSDNFTVKLWGRNFISDNEIFRMSTVSGDIISLRYVTDDGLAHLELMARNRQIAYVTSSQEVNIPANSDNIYIMLRRIDNLYQIDFVNKGGVSA